MNLLATSSSLSLLNMGVLQYASASSMTLAAGSFLDLDQTPGLPLASQGGTDLLEMASAALPAGTRPVDSHILVTTPEQRVGAGLPRPELEGAETAPLRAALATGAMMMTGCSPDLTTNTIVLGGVSLLVGVSLMAYALWRRFRPQPPVVEVVPLSRPLVEEVEGTSLPVAFTREAPMRYLSVGSEGIAVTAGKTQQGQHLVEFIQHQAGRYLMRNAAPADQHLQFWILRDDQLNYFESDGWSEVKEGDNFMVVDSSQMREGVPIIQSSMQFRKSDNGPQLIPVEVNSDRLPKQLGTAMETIPLKKIPYYAVQRYRHNFIHEFYSRLNDTDPDIQRGRAIQDSIEERNIIIRAWESLTGPVREHYLGLEPETDAGSPRIPHRFLRDYLIHRSADAVISSFPLGAPGDRRRLITEIAGRLEGEITGHLLAAEFCTERKVEAIENGVRLHFSSSPDEDRVFMLGRAGATQEGVVPLPGTESIAAIEDPHFELSRDEGGHLSLRNLSLLTGTRFYVMNTDLSWSYSDLNPNSHYSPTLRQGTRISIGDRFYQIDVGRGTVTLREIDGAFAEEARFRPLLPPPPPRESAWMTTMGEQMDLLVEIRDWVGADAEGILPDAIQILDEAIDRKQNIWAGDAGLRAKTIVRFALDHAATVHELMPVVDVTDDMLQEVDDDGDVDDDNRVTQVMKRVDLMGEANVPEYEAQMGRLQRGLAQVTDEQGLRLVGDANRILHEALTDNRSLTVAEQATVTVALKYVEETVLEVESAFLDRLRSQRARFVMMARFEEGKAQQFLENAATILEDAISSDEVVRRGKLGDIQEQLIQRANDYVTELEGYESFEKLQTVTGALDHARAAGQAPSDQEPVATDAVSSEEALVQQQAGFLAEFRREREAFARRYLEPLGHWSEPVPVDEPSSPQIVLPIDDVDQLLCIDREAIFRAVQEAGWQGRYSDQWLRDNVLTVEDLIRQMGTRRAKRVWQIASEQGSRMPIHIERATKPPPLPTTPEPPSQPLTGWEELPNIQIDHNAIEAVLRRRGLAGIYDSGKLRHIETVSDLQDYLGRRMAGRVIRAAAASIDADAVIAESILQLAERSHGRIETRRAVVLKTILRSLETSRLESGVRSSESVRQYRERMQRERLEEQRRRSRESEPA